MNKGIEKLREHNISLSKGGVGTLSATEVKDSTLESLGSFAQEVQQLRTGKAEDEKGNKITPINVSFEEAVTQKYGCDVPQFLQGLGIYTNSMSLEGAARELGCDNLSLSSVENLMLNHGEGSFESIGTPANTTQVTPDHRFIIPELIAAAIRIGYQNSSMHQNWITGTQNMSNREIKMPQIKRGDGMPTVVNEGADIPMGSVQFGQKQADTFKIGTGFSLTDELIIESPLDMMFIFLQEVGNDMSIGADVLALDILLNGEQGDGSESAPVVGVDNTGTISYKDMKRIFTRMQRMSQPASRIITSEENGIDITGIDKFEGYQGQSRLANIRSIIGVPESFELDTHVPPANQSIFLDPQRAMVKLQFRGMVTERRRNIKNQTEELFISDHIGFAIVKRDARVVLDKSIAFSGNGFPAYMDIDARIAQAFKQF